MSGQIIAAHEGQEVHNSLIDALVAQEIRRQNDARVAEALAAKQRAEDEAALMRRAYSEYWTGKIDDSAALYSRNPRPGRLATAALVAWALVALVIATGWHMLMASLGMDGR